MKSIHHHIKKEVTNFRKPLEVRLKLAITHLATGEMYTSLRYHWQVGQTTIFEFVPKVCHTILDEFKKDYLSYPTTPEDWKGIEKFRTRSNVSHAHGALDRIDIAMKKPKKSWSKYYKYNGFFFLVLPALANTDNRFHSADVGSSGSSSDAQIFTRSELKKIEECGFCFPPPESLGEDGQICTTFCWMMTYSP